MRIAMIAHTNAPWTPRFARFFQDRGDDLLVVTFSPDKLDGVNTNFVGVAPFDRHRGKRLYFTRVPRVRRLLQAFAPDVVFAPFLASNGLTAALAFRGPLVVYALGSDVLEHAGRRGLRRRIREAYVRFVFNRADVVCTVSETLDQALTHLGAPPSKLVRLPIGVSMETFHPDPAMPRPAASRFICTRQHEPIYDIRTIIGALRRLQDTRPCFHCSFTSTGRLLDEHRRLVDDLGLNEHVTFTGHLSHDELPRLLRESDIYISASLGDGTSVALLEAMAVGLLPVVSRIPANVPWIDEGRTGLLFDVGNAEDLARNLETAMDDADLRRRAFEENRRLVTAKADMQTNMNELVKVFTRAIAAHR